MPCWRCGTKYDLNDPDAGNGLGVFTNTTLQELYDTLVARGSKSPIDAVPSTGKSARS